MQMDTRVPLMGQVANPLQAYTQGVSARDAVEEMSRQNALQSFLQNNGQALYAGDQNAIQEFANYDLAGAMGLQQEFEARRQRAAAASAGAGRARQQAGAEALQRAFDVMEVAHGQGEEAFNAALDSYGYRDEAEQYGINFGNFGQAASVARAHLGFEQPAVPEGVANVQNNRAAWEAAGFDLNDPRFREFALTGEMPSAPEAPDQPSSVREVDFLAESLGFAPGSPEYNDLALTMLGPSAGTQLSVDPETGAVSFSQGGPAGGGAAQGTEFNTRFDRAVGADVAEWESVGRAAAQSNLAMLGQAVDAIEGGAEASGPLLGTLMTTLPGVASIVAPEATNIREQVEGVVQQNLRTVLGAQFTEREGERLISRAYNPRLPEEVNITRLRALQQQMQTAYNQREAMSAYARENGTMVGYDGPRPTMADFYAAIEGAGGDASGEGSNISVGSPDATDRPAVGGNLLSMSPEQLSTIGTADLRSVPSGQLRSILENMTPDQRLALRRRIMALSEGN